MGAWKKIKVCKNNSFSKAKLISKYVTENNLSLLVATRNKVTEGILISLSHHR